jgi:tetratricopeptide (TPR) repeat protein
VFFEVPEDEYNEEAIASPKVGIPGVLENVKAQQAGVRARLRSRDLAGARRFADDLVQHQRLNSEPEHIAKTLDLLAQAAKEEGLTDLQLEWAQRANEINPRDPMTFGHLADALICAGRLTEAYEAIAQTEQLGNRAYAGNMRARIRREEGRFQEAHDMYLSVAKEFDTAPDVHHSWAGVAETLRDMGRYDEAQALPRACRALALRRCSKNRVSFGSS